MIQNTMNTETSNEKSNFTEINLLDTQRKKAPKRLVYFSDGILEEYSSDDEDVIDCNVDASQSLIDPKTLQWIPYLGYMLWMIGSRTLSACDYLGENLAWFFGITSPKFQYELDQFQKLAKEEEELEKHIKAENAGWGSNEIEHADTIALQPVTLKTEVKQIDEIKVPIDDDVMILDESAAS